MSTTTAPPATTPLPVQLSESEGTAGIFPHLSIPKRGPQGTRGYHRVLHLILWVRYTGMQWQYLPVPTDTQGKPALHATPSYKVFARWAHEGSLGPACVASVRPLAAEQHLDTSVLHGDGPNTGAHKGAMASGTQGPHIRQGKRSAPSRTTTATGELQDPSPPSTRPRWFCSRRGCKHASGWPQRWGWASAAPLSTSMAALILPTIDRASSMRA